jgi:hypothetical protein
MDNNNLTLRRRHNPLQMSSADEEDTKHRGQRRIFASKQALSIVVAVIFCICSYHVLTRSQLSVSAESVELKSETAAEAAATAVRHKVDEKATNNNTPLVQHASSKEFDCAIFWLRMPKTASTTIAQTFMRPIFREGNFTNLDLGPNSCVTHVGGCAPFWKAQSGMPKKTGIPNQRQIGGVRRLSETMGQSSYVPPFGRKVPMASDKQFNTNQRCFPSEENQRNNRQTQCHEYDASTSTMNYGHRPVPHGKRALPVKVQAQFDAAQRLTTHVGLDPSLFGWILPPNPMVFSTFRDPLERIFSSFHYGIQFGGGRPGSVGRCKSILVYEVYA